VKDKIIAGSVYAVAFVLVTAVIAMANGMYRNIFKFDFREPIGKAVLESNMDIEDIYKLKEKIELTIRDSYQDSLASIKAKTQIDSNGFMIDETILDSIEILKENLRRLERQKEEQIQEKNALKEELTKKEEYDEWVKRTSSLYEAMEPERVAKIITKYSDNVARDLLYKMKKKKTVEILAALNPETVIRLTKE
jgi:flagellar motility protein MotE (MotC chaperone)